MKSFLSRSLFFAGIVAAWELLTRAFKMPLWLLPPPSAVWDAFIGAAPYLAESTWVTLYETLLGLAAGSIGGMLMAIAIAHSNYLRSTLLPAVVAFEAFPKIAIAPLIVVWFGLGVEAKIVMAFLIVFFPIMINTAAGLEKVEPELIDLARVNSATKWQILYEIRWPNALPYVFEGLKIALPLSLIGAIIAEFVASRAGLGYIIVNSSATLNTPLVFVALALLAVITLILYSCLVFAENRILKWHRRSAR